MKFVDYFEDPDDPLAPSASEESPSSPAPRPGHGTVWVNGSHDSGWSASWQDGPRLQDSPEGSREQAMEWARAVPAEQRYVFSSELDDYVTFD